MLLRQTLLYLPAQLFAPLAQFVAAVVWTHWMAPDAYGVLSFLLAAQDLVFVACLSWWSGFCLRYFAGFDADDLERYRRSEAAVLVLTVAFCAAASVALLSYLRILDDHALAICGVVFLASRSINIHLAERARALERIFDYTVAQTAGPVAGFGLALLGVHFLDARAAVILGGFAAAQSVAALWLKRRLGVDLSIRWPDAAMMRRALTYGAPMIAGGTLGWVGLNGIRFVVQEMGGDTAVGLLAVGWNLGQRLAGVTAMLVTAAAFPLTVRRLATHSRADAMQKFGESGTLLLGIVAPSTIGLWQISPLLVNLLIAEPYRAATLTILPAAVMAGAIRNLRVHYADQTFLLFERTGTGVGAFLLEATSVCVLSAVGYRWGGLQGAVFGCLIANVLTTISVFAVARLVFALPIPVWDWLRIALATAVMAFAVHGAQILPGSDLLRILVQIATGAAVYVLALSVLFQGRLADIRRQMRPPALSGTPMTAKR